ncbi:hypothetical protein LguiA_002439 [Lonicera macranthoides]
MATATAIAIIIVTSSTILVAPLLPYFFFIIILLHHHSLVILSASDPYRCFDNNTQYPLNSLPNPRKLTLSGFGNVNIVATVVTILLNLLNVLVCKLSQLYESISDVRSTVSEKLCGRFSLAEILLAPNDFVESLVIGRGGFEKVFRGSIDSWVANYTDTIKRLNPMYKQGTPEFWIEITMPSKFRHSHRVHGTILDQNLYKIGNNNVHLYCFKRLKICIVCICTARGLDYLHITIGVQHRDILLDDNWSAKILDFKMFGYLNPSTF